MLPSLVLCCLLFASKASAHPMGETTRQQTFGKQQIKGDNSTVNDTQIIIEHGITANQNSGHVSISWQLTLGKQPTQGDISTANDKLIKHKIKANQNSGNLSFPMGEKIWQLTLGKTQTQGDISTANDTPLIIEHGIKANPNSKNVSISFPKDKTTWQLKLGEQPTKVDISTVHQNPTGHLSLNGPESNTFKFYHESTGTHRTTMDPVSSGPNNTQLIMKHESEVRPNKENISVTVDMPTQLTTNGHSISTTNGHSIPTKEMSKTDQHRSIEKVSDGSEVKTTQNTTLGQQPKIPDIKLFLSLSFGANFVTIPKNETTHQTTQGQNISAQIRTNMRSLNASKDTNGQSLRRIYPTSFGETQRLFFDRHTQKESGEKVLSGKEEEEVNKKHIDNSIYSIDNSNPKSNSSINSKSNNGDLLRNLEHNNNYSNSSSKAISTTGNNTTNNNNIVQSSSSLTKMKYKSVNDSNTNSTFQTVSSLNSDDIPTNASIRHLNLKKLTFMSALVHKKEDSESSSTTEDQQSSFTKLPNLKFQNVALKIGGILSSNKSTLTRGSVNFGIRFKLPTNFTKTEPKTSTTVDFIESKSTDLSEILRFKSKIQSILLLGESNKTDPSLKIRPEAKTVRDFENKTVICNGLKSHTENLDSIPNLNGPKHPMLRLCAVFGFMISATILVWSKMDRFIDSGEMTSSKK